MASASSPARQFGAAISAWASIVGLTMVQEFDRRFKNSRFGALFALLEPILIIALIAAFRGQVKGMLPHFGMSAVVFISSGVFPFYVFLRLSTRTRGAQYDAGSRLLRVTSTEALVAGIAAEAALILTAMVLWFSAMWWYGLVEAKPKVLEDCLVSLGILAMAGVGVGLINAAISRRFPLWSHIYAIPSRGLLVLSGAYYVVDLLPIFFRNIVVWNPLAHGIEWFRLGLYAQYPAVTMDREYFVLFAAIALFLGVAAHRGTIRSERQ